MKPGAIIVQVLLSITNASLLGVGIYMLINGAYPYGAQIAIWGAFVGLVGAQVIFFKGDKRG